MKPKSATDAVFFFGDGSCGSRRVSQVLLQLNIKKGGIKEEGKFLWATPASRLAKAKLVA
jgi:hypothetical protein